MDNANENKEFIIDDDNMIMQYKGNGGNVIIPYGVTDIFFAAFYGAAPITGITIPGSIPDISPFVFENSERLKRVIINEGVSIIGVCSFNNCKKLETVSIPKSIKHIGMNAFGNCASLKKIYYNGSEKDWDSVTKEDDWNENTSGYTVIFN